MVKKAGQQGRSERRAEEVHTELRSFRSHRSYASGYVLRLRLRYVEGLSDARTQLTAFFTILLRHASIHPNDLSGNISGLL